ncbi:MAG: DHH family phosphoesterase [Spirochaetota bacterium]
MMTKNFIKTLIGTVSNDPYVYIQPHNFPDHDAVASGYALQQLLHHFGTESRLVYEGEIQRDSLMHLITSLKIDIRHISEYKMSETDRVIIVDGCKGNKNVTDLIGDEIALIDHHRVSAPDDVPICDIRPEYGACSTILFTYYDELGIDIPRNVATALIVGIDMDTALFTRDASEADVSAYASLYGIADIHLVNSILRNYIQIKDLKFYREAIDNVFIRDMFAYCYFPEGCNQNLLGILGDFLLALREVDFVVLAANNHDRINLSLRSERDEWNAARIVQEVLDGIGFGGGHADMAGGIIDRREMFDSTAVKEKFLHVLGI